MQPWFPRASVAEIDSFSPTTLHLSITAYSTILGISFGVGIYEMLSAIQTFFCLSVALSLSLAIILLLDKSIRLHNESVPVNSVFQVSHSVSLSIFVIENCWPHLHLRKEILHYHLADIRVKLQDEM